MSKKAIVTIMQPWKAGTIVSKWRQYWGSDSQREQVLCGNFDYIEVFYNRQRLHSSLDYLAPKTF